MLWEASTNSVVSKQLLRRLLLMRSKPECELKPLRIPSKQPQTGQVLTRLAMMERQEKNRTEASSPREDLQSFVAAHGPSSAFAVLEGFHS
jgi:hypothetical protein